MQIDKIIDESGGAFGYEEIAKKYASTWINQDVASVDMGDASAQNDLFLFLIELAERREITALDEYKEKASEVLAEEYEQENISESRIVAQTYILQMKNERLYGVYEEEIKKSIEESSMAIKNLPTVKKEFVLGLIKVEDKSENDITECLTEKGKLQYVAKMLHDEAFYENNLKRFNGNAVNIIAEHIQGLPGYLNVPYENDDIDAVGKEWGYDLSNDDKVFAFREKWFPMIANRLNSLFYKHGIDPKNPPQEFEYCFDSTLLYLAKQDSKPRTLACAGPFAREYAIPATEGNIELLKKIGLYVFDTVQTCDNKEHPDFGKQLCFFAAPKIEDIEAEGNNAVLDPSLSIDGMVQEHEARDKRQGPAETLG